TGAGDPRKRPIIAKSFYDWPIGSRPEEFGQLSRWTEQGVPQPFPKMAIDPKVQRDTEAPLWLVGHRLRQLTLRNFTQNSFTRSVLHFKTMGKRKSKGKQILIQHRHTNFEAFLHTGGVHLEQEIIRLSQPYIHFRPMRGEALNPGSAGLQMV